MTTPADLIEQAAILDDAGKRSPLGVYQGLLVSRAKELRATAKAAQLATEDGWTYDLVPAAGLESGIPVYDKSFGPVSVRRVSRGGLGIECENESGYGEPIIWINPLAPTSLIVVLGQRRERVVDDDGVILSAPGSEEHAADVDHAATA